MVRLHTMASQTSTRALCLVEVPRRRSALLRGYYFDDLVEELLIAAVDWALRNGLLECRTLHCMEVYA